MPSIIATKNLGKTYHANDARKRHFALSDVNITVEKGKTVGLLGLNGAGKSTLMKIVMGIMYPTQGSCLVDGLDVMNLTREVKKRIGYLSESPPLYDEMLVEDYLQFASALKDTSLAFSKKKRTLEVHRVMELLDIKTMRSVVIRALSKGYRQRVGLAMALLTDPEILIFDEVSAGVDPKQVLSIRNLIKQMAGKKTILYSSHILSEVKAVATDIIFLHHGKVYAAGSINSIVKKLSNTNKLFIHLKKKQGEQAKKVLQEYLSKQKERQTLLSMALVPAKENKNEIVLVLEGVEEVLSSKKQLQYFKALEQASVVVESFYSQESASIETLFENIENVAT